MTLHVFGSVRASPGVTTTALAVAACLPDAVLVEADCDGGVLAVRYGLGREPGLSTLAAADGEPGDLMLLDHAQRLPGGVPVVVGSDSPELAVSLWRSAGKRLAAMLSAAEGSVVVDAGRLAPTSPAVGALVPAASAVLVVARPHPEELVAVAHRLPGLRRANPRVLLVLVGERPYRPAEVAAQLSCDLAGVVAADPRAARVLAGGGASRALHRSALVRTTRSLAETLAARPEQKITPDDPKSEIAPEQDDAEVAR